MLLPSYQSCSRLIAIDFYIRCFIVFYEEITLIYVRCDTGRAMQAEFFRRRQQSASLWCRRRSNLVIKRIFCEDLYDDLLWSFGRKKCRWDKLSLSKQLLNFDLEWIHKFCYIVIIWIQRFKIMCTQLLVPRCFNTNWHHYQPKCKQIQFSYRDDRKKDAREEIVKVGRYQR